MMSLENISSPNANGISFTHLNNSFEPGRIHGIWNESDNVNTGFLHLLAGKVPLSSGVIRLDGKTLDHAKVAYYSRADMPDAGNRSGSLLDNRKWVYLFDNVLDPADMASIVRLFKIIHPLKQRGATVLIASSDHKVLRPPTDLFHILSKGAFQASLHARQYHLLDAVFRYVQRS